jgi:CheY-like chemotaxis protein
VTTDILIVEDSPIAVRLVRASLAELPATFRTAGDGKRALEEIAEQVPDLVVLDLGLPTLDGWAVLERVRSDPATRSLPVVVITGLGGERLEQRATIAGADAFFAKPFSRAALADAVRELLRN